MTACGSDEKETTTKQKEDVTEKKETDFDIVSKTFTFEKEDVEGTMVGIAKDDGVKKFSMYIALSDKDTEMEDAVDLMIGEMIYHMNGNNSEIYFISIDQVLVTMTDTTSESMKKSMDTYLEEKGITLDQLKNAMKEKFDIQ